MRIVGELVDAVGTKSDVFDGYVVHIQYSVKATATGAEGAYRDTEDELTLRDKDPSFAFDLPEPQQLALEKPLLVRVHSRTGKEVFQSEELLASLLHSDKKLEIRIREVEPVPVSTPVEVRGFLRWKDTPDRTDGFDGFTVLASFSAREGGDGSYQPRLVSSIQGEGNRFKLTLPTKDQLSATRGIEVVAKYPDGQIAVTTSFALETLREEISLVVPQPPKPIVVRSDTRAEDAKPIRLKGKVVDLSGKTAISNRQVILWGLGADQRMQPVLVTTTDGVGYFAGPWPKFRLKGGLATVAGTYQSSTEQALTVALDPVQGDNEQGLGTFPTFVYLVVNADPSADSDQPCDCDVSTTPRQPDAEDLVANPKAYSQDIGPNCVNFTTPNRTLEEFVYTLVVRTTDPEIKGTTLSDLERRSLALDHMRNTIALEPRFQFSAAMISPSVTRQPFTPGATKAAIGAELKNRAAALSAYSFASALPPYWSNAFKAVPARGPLNAENSVDWDSTPTFYQAATIAHGHILYYKQSWKADGYSLGDLIYSLPLAPGQKKQVVIFDWDRTEYGRRDEASHEDEALNSYLSHNRDLIDITHASLGEHMKAGSTSHTSGEAGGIGAGIGALIGPVMIGVAGGYSASSGSASSSAWQDSSRDLSASGLNQLRDLIQQGASAVRNQRSTVVQTARQTERFKVESEVVANHNHCHAITIEYFEVLRHYAIEQQLTQVQECLFIPLLMSQFDVAKVVRWRDILRSALLLSRRSLFSVFEQHPLQRGIDACERIFLNYEGSDLPSTTYAAESVTALSGELHISFRLNRPLDADDDADDPAKQDQLMTLAVFQSSVGWNVWWPLLPWGPGETFQQFFAHQKVKYKNKIFEERVAPVLAEALVDQLKFTAVSTTGARIPLLLDTTLLSSYQRDVELYCTVRPLGSTNVRRDQIDFIEIATDVDLSPSAQSKIIINSATLRYSTPHLNGYLAQDYRVDNDIKPNDPVVIYTPLSAEEKRNPHEEDKRFSKLLLEHLNAHLEYYHKAIWSQMDPDRRYMLLDGFVAPNAGGKSVASVVENRVIGIAGNCLIMPVAPGYKLDPTYTYEPKRNADGEPIIDENGNTVFEQTSLFDHYKPLTPVPPFRVSVPTRGVFAEAVMGACNSCEKWDESRYWKWEEHPIPEEPTPIAPVETRPPQRSEPGSLTPTPFPAPMINIQNAPSAPEPGSTLAGALGVLGKSDLFKDITGLEQTQKNALQAMLSNQESAKHFADKAAELAVQAQNLKSAPTTIDSIKKSMADGTLDKATGQKLITDAYRAQIDGKTQATEPSSSAAKSELGNAAADAVRSGREVKALQTHPDGTQTQIEQKGAVGTDLSSAATIGLERPDPADLSKWIPIPLGEGPGMAQFDRAFSSTGNLEADFPSKDSGRFRIVLTDPAFKTSSVEQVRWNTIYDNGKNQSFEAGGLTTIDLQPDPADPSRRVSQSLVIVADAEDLPIANSIGSAKNARLGGMFGHIVVERDGKRFEGPILQRSKHWLLPVHIFVVKRSAGDGGVTAIAPFTAAALGTQLRGMQQILEPHGIFINSQSYTFSTAQTSKFSPTERNTGTEVVYRYYEIDVPVSEVASLPGLSLDNVNKLGAAFPPNSGGPVLRLFFVPGFDTTSRLATSINQSRVDSFTTMDAGTKAAVLNSVYIGPNASRAGAVHEVCHTLMDKNKFMRDNAMPAPTNPAYAHHYKTPTTPGYPESHNLMRPTDAPTMRRIWLIADGDGYNWKEAINANRAKLLLRP